jgi:hypothetical protein
LLSSNQQRFFISSLLHLPEPSATRQHSNESKPPKNSVHIQNPNMQYRESPFNQGGQTPQSLAVALASAALCVGMHLFTPPLVSTLTLRSSCFALRSFSGR